ncbi:translesion DNA synthesis-associated protein ImuA [Burkholderia vietnamiensis]|uniref:translesion DNA synthesis-associated protein ImuA n=1 Tax=Burkholderia vietnamiensis TaxID=60552 RepID=UPI0026501325|nr:translesion DNA synthesis-associated protein ImuA [Burkholderia vietnamiensis]MDN7408007.1 translesion DNA synthesis-associated protein ImuA [Burkholderia vietnamiensis]
MAALLKPVESIHPSLWLGSQLARAYGKTVDTGYAALSAELPGGGWPLGALVELLVQQPGIGEMRLLRPALSELSTRPVALLQAPHVPNALAFSYLGLPMNKLMRLRAPKTADALWCAERVLQAKTCGALVFWQQHIRTEALRRLHLAAQATESLLVVIRPLASAQDASPATLRLGVRPADGGLVVDVVKRRGPTRTETLSVALQPSPILLSPYGRVRRHLPAPAFAGGIPSPVVTAD